jgi:hypothetical protein
MDSSENNTCDDATVAGDEANNIARRNLLVTFIKEMARADHLFEMVGVEVIPVPEKSPDEFSAAFVIMGQPLYFSIDEDAAGITLAFHIGATPTQTPCKLTFAKRSDEGDFASLALAAYIVVRDTEVIETKRIAEHRLKQINAHLGALHHHESAMVGASRAHWPFEVLKIDDALKRLIKPKDGTPEPKRSPLLGVN